MVVVTKQEGNYRYTGQPLQHTGRESNTQQKAAKAERGEQQNHQQNRDNKPTETKEKEPNRGQKSKKGNNRKTRNKKKAKSKKTKRRELGELWPDNITYIQDPLENPFLITHHQDQQKHEAGGDLGGRVEKEREARGKQKEPP